MGDKKLNFNNFKINIVRGLQYIFIQKNKTVTFITICLFSIYGYYFLNIEDFFVAEEYKNYLKNEHYLKIVLSAFLTLLFTSVLGSTFMEKTAKEKHVSFNKCLAIFLIGLLGLHELRNNTVYGLHQDKIAKAQRYELKQHIERIERHLGFTKNQTLPLNERK